MKCGLLSKRVSHLHCCFFAQSCDCCPCTTSVCPSLPGSQLTTINVSRIHVWSWRTGPAFANDLAKSLEAARWCGPSPSFRSSFTVKLVDATILLTDLCSAEPIWESTIQTSTWMIRSKCQPMYNFMLSQADYCTTTKKRIKFGGLYIIQMERIDAIKENS